MSNVINLFKPEKPNESYINFDPTIASKIGLENAIMLAYLYDQLSDEHELVEENHIWWRCISHKKLRLHFPFWHMSKITWLIRDLTQKGLVMNSYFPRYGERAKCYHVTDAGWRLMD